MTYPAVVSQGPRGFVDLGLEVAFVFAESDRRARVVVSYLEFLLLG